MRVLALVEPPSDRELLQGLARTDPVAFEQLYERYSERLFAFLLRLSGRRHVAEDLFQEVWCNLALHARQLVPETDALAWLLTVGRNAYYDRARRERRWLPMPPGFEQPATQNIPDRTAESRQELALLEAALVRLADIDREVLLLLFVEGLEPERAERILGISNAALRKRLSRARERLLELMSQPPLAAVGRHS